MENEKIVCCPFSEGGGGNNLATIYTMNLIASVQGDNLQKWSGGDERIYLSMCHDLSASKLCDIDKPKFVRWYAGV